jgi:hypothetical protein
LLRFNGTSWVNWTHSFLTSSSTLGDLFNVGSSADGANNGDILRFDEAAGLWVADEFPSFTESDTLDSVTDRGTTTTNSITVGGLSTSGTVTAAVVTTPLIEREGVLTINSEEQVDQGDPNPNLLYVSWNGDNKFVINADGYAIASTGYKVTGGTASGFLKANGTIDTSTYLTSYTETQTLDAVTDLGSTTTNNISVGGLTSTSVSTPIVQSNNGVLTITADSSGSLQPEQGDPAVKVLSFKWSTTEFGFLDTDGKIAFQGFKTPTGTASGFLKANGTVDTSAYITEIEYLDDIGDVVISTPATGDVLTFDGSEWVNSPIDSADYVSKVQHEVKAGVAITKGQALYVTGADGTNIVVGKASNVSEAMSSKTIGLAAASAAVNGKFFVITEGLLAGLNTSAANVGDAVWLGVDGALIFGLTNKPYAPAHLVYIGVVTRANANNGEIFISVQNGFELKELHDVFINGVATGNLIRRDSDGLWKNWAPNYITANSVDTLLNKTIPLGTGIATIVAVDDISGFVGQSGIPIYQDGIDKGGTISIDGEYTISIDNPGIGYYPGTATTSGGTRFVITINGNVLTGSLAEFNKALTDAVFATEGYVTTQIANLVDSAPATLDTLNELAAALGDDANFATTVTTSIATKQPQLNGTGFVRASGTTISYDNSTYLTSESDPVFTSSAAYEITNENLSEWGQAYGWGDHSLIGYLTSESDPVFTGSAAYGITSENLLSWNDAYGWGNHADYGYLTTLPDHNHDDRYYTESESDTKFYLATNPSDYQTTTGTVAKIASGDISNLNTAWKEPGSSIANGFVVYRYGSSSTNQPVVADNANWLINIYSHPAEGEASYGHQLAAANGNDIYFRSVSNGTFSGWHKFWSTNDFSSATIDNWNSGYDNSITAASFATATGILTLTQQDLGTVTVNLDGRYLTSASDSQTLSYDPGANELTISNGNSITLEGLATETFVTNQGYITGISFANVSSKPTTISGYGITDAITTSNIGSQSVSYAISSGNSSTTDQTVFGSLFINDAAVATEEFVTSQGYLTTLPAHNHDDRYYTETESDSRYINASGDTMSGSLSFDPAAVIKKRITLSGFNPVKTSSGVLTSISDNGSGYTYYVIETNVPQDEYQMGGFTIELFGRYGETNNKTKIDLGGYWNPEGNGGFAGFEAHGTNPQYKPTIEVCRNINGNTAFIIYGVGWAYPVIVARDLWLGYNDTDGSQYGEGWAITGTNDVSSYTNKDTVVWRNAYSDSNPDGYITGYTETDTLASVTARGASTSTNSVFTGGLQARKNQTNNNYTTAALWTESYGNTTTGIAFHISGNVGKFLEMRTDGILYWEDRQVWTSGNLTDLNQLTNTPGYITGISFANVSSKPTTIAGYGITDAITTANIGSQSVNFATSSGNSSTTDQTVFGALFINDSAVATEEFVTSQGYLTSLPAHTHTIANVTGLQTALDDKLSTSGKAADSDLLDGQDQSYYFSKANIDASRNIGASTNLDTDLENGGSYGSYGAGGTSWNSPFPYGGVIAFALTSGIKAQFGFDIRHTQSDYGDLWYRTKNNVGYSTWRTMWHSGNLTNLNQLTNGPGYITGYTETDTLGTVTNRGNSTSQNIVFSNGRKGLVGVYNAAQTQAIFAMGIDYILTDEGASGTIGNHYGLAWSYNPDYGGVGNNPQSKAGLNHQLLLMQAGVTTAAMGSGIWTSGLITTTSYGTSANWNTAFGWGNHASAGYIVQGTQILSGASWTTATRFGSVGDISQEAGNHALSVRSEVGNDAFMSFHIGNDYAVHFGLDDVTNRLHVGGWSDGAVKYQLWDSRDFSSTDVSNWNTAYNDRISSATVTGTTTKTLTLTQGDGGTVTASWTDYDTDNDAQQLSYDPGANQLSISNGNSIELTGLATEEFVTGQGYLTSLPAHNHDDRYYTETESDSRYVNTSGDTMSGNLTLSGYTDPHITLTATSGSYSYLELYDGSTYGYIIKNVTSSTTNGVLAGSLYLYTDNSKATQIVHGGVSNAAFLSGGDVYIRGQIYVVGNGASTGTQVVYNTGTWGINITGNADTATNLRGTGGSFIQSTSTGTSYINNYQVRENSGGGSNTNEIYAPQLAFHWSGVVASSIMMEASGRMAIRNNPGDSYENFIAAVVYSYGYGDSTQWNTAYGWGNHSGLYLGLNSKAADSELLDGVDESRFVYGNSNTRRGTNLISNWNQNDYPDVAFLSAENGATNAPSSDYTYGTQYSFHRSGAAYRTQLVTALYSDTSIYVRNSRDSDVWTSWKRLWHSGDFTSTNVSNWNTAYGWGNHAGLYLPLSGGTMTGSITLKYSTADSSDYDGLRFAPYSDVAGLDDYIIKAASDKGVFGRKSFGWHIHTESAFGVYSSGWTQLFGVEGGTGNTQVFGSLTVNGSITESSSIRYKKDIVDIEHSSSKIELLRPVRYKKIKDESEEIGLIAEDVAELFPEVVKYDNEGRPDGVNYSRLSVILLKAVQELTERVNKLENK